MDPDKIELQSVTKMFEYEKQARAIDELNNSELKIIAKSYCKLYLKQQEVVLNLGLTGI
jgi:hypothetical protein